MRAFLLAFVLPMGFFWSWYLLSANDISFGFFMYTREMHDFVFRTYGEMIGIDPAIIPPLLIRACIVDTFIILGIWAFRRRREIAAWWRKRQGMVEADPAARRYAEISSPGNS
jgi:hypothetical protein